MEFLKNRQKVIQKAARDAQLSFDASLPAVLSDTQLGASVTRTANDIKKKRKQLEKRLLKLIDNLVQDPVYKVLDNVFQSESDHVLTRDMDEKHMIKRLARRRFQLGYPPRKEDDTSMGDAINWEWIIHCALNMPGQIIIVSRDSDYGCTYEDKYFLNDQLKQEFRDRVGRKSIVLTHKLSDALDRLNVRVTMKERESEQKAISIGPSITITNALAKRMTDIDALMKSTAYEQTSQWSRSLAASLGSLEKIQQDRAKEMAELLDKYLSSRSSDD